MKGFIEVTIEEFNSKRVINIKYLKEFQCYTEHPTLTMNNDEYFRIKESYEEVKQLIKEATEL